ncbi:probable LRR receptor-like serine/threonine-protein kinase At1g74360 [Punica granatum]|uniref:non-specific serine/threonine protein kinase n=2 Tax=Punica granatum TaxID=22663 RepID=A0A218VXF9_PUNGR|nr:probable LRR receptor-like serine/threonine-protein kinase At1g74360 [Punica granatum]XP_031407422.1 probable LRR receptor-like serine/threonine-protein kinase At1g74360 [Punica granatum]OWM65254.1 hypothetical protein CDL15_Pgr008844 [Punica granatum]PKI72153.1 hypothetical protein CRG98_007472 [Punica granatum]
MSDEETDSWKILLTVFMLFLGVIAVLGDSIDRDREVLLNLKQFLEESNRVNRGHYSEWNSSSSPCVWKGIRCSTPNGSTSARVSGVDLSGNTISSAIFHNFSALTELSYLDLSQNTIGGSIPQDLSQCPKLSYLNLSHNLLEGELNLTGLRNLRTLDLSMNRFGGEIRSSFSTICDSLVVLNISSNNLTGSIGDSFDQCYRLEHLDLSTNKFIGNIWGGFGRLQKFSVSENYLSGQLSASSFPQNCSLRIMDFSQNNFSGLVPEEVSNCRNLVILNLWGNNFTGQMPGGIGSISGLKGLFLGNNSFLRDIPESLLNLSNLAFLDLSRNKFGGEIQGIFGRFTSVKYLVLHGNSYTSGIKSSGILELHNLVRLDLSFNNFSGPLPSKLSQMQSLKFLILASNQFNGTIPVEFGSFPRLQALDLSYNELTGTIPPSLGNLTSLLWLMLANNQLTGQIPPEIGNCSSLLWLNLANNQLTGNYPPELVNIGQNPRATFESNLLDNDHVIAGSGECLAMRRWIPADYPPFSFVYTLLTRKTCRGIWDRLLKGIGLFPLCGAESSTQTYQISGYVQLSGNSLSGLVPSEIGKMKNFSMINLGMNNFSGEFPREVRQLPLVVLNLSSNGFSGAIPSELGDNKCLQNLDLSNNNFSGMFPTSLNNLTNLSKFNVSYNPFISGAIPATGQLATFEKESFLGDPLLHLPYSSTGQGHSPNSTRHRGSGTPKKPSKLVESMVFLALISVFLLFGIFSFIVCTLIESPLDLADRDLLENAKYEQEFGSSSGCSSPWLSEMVPVIQLVKRAFTYADILKATGNFSNDKVIGKGGFGTVYRGVLPDGREVAVKKLQREGIEGEKEFQAEMEVLCGDSFDWPHPNLVPLYGWCLYRSEKILVYKYMEGGSLEDLILDRLRLTWQRRVHIAVDVARALVFLHHECFPAIVHRDVKASNVLLDGSGRACMTDFGLARTVDAGDSHVSTVVAGTIGYVAPEYGQTWRATTKGDVYSFGVLAMELATGRRALDGGEECLVEWARRVFGPPGSDRAVLPVAVLGSGLAEGAEEMCELLKIGIRCTAESPHLRPNMKEVFGMLFRVSSNWRDQIHSNGSSPASK